MSGKRLSVSVQLTGMPDMEKSNLRAALGSFITGVTIVTVFDANNEPWGVTANSFTSVSLEPPLVLVCIGKKGRTYPTFAASDRFAVNVLSAGQQGLARHFAGQTENRFTGVDFNSFEDGAPLLHGTAAWFDCRVHDRISAADHEILIGQVGRFNNEAIAPLGYCRGSFVTAHPAL